MAIGCWLFSSCGLESVKDITEGTQEEYVILDKNSGTLQVTELHKDDVARFEINESNPYDVSSIEFTADGKYHITFNNPSYARSMSQGKDSSGVQCVNIEVEGQTISVPMRAASVTRSSAPIESTGTYTRVNGRYVLADYGWEMYGNKLLITENGITRSYAATSASPINKDALTSRLCHTWTLSRVLVKIYKNKNLVLTYHLTDEEVYMYCIDTFVFSSFRSSPGYASFYRYKNRKTNGIGEWKWMSLAEQNLFYQFTYFDETRRQPVLGSNTVTVYFANNRLYITEKNDNIKTNYEDTNDKTVYSAMLLYQLDVKGN